MNELEDIKLKTLLQEMQLDSPEANFSVRVMNKIFEENSVLEKIKSQRVLGNGFWIIMILFVILFAAVIILNNTGISTVIEVDNLIPELNNGVSNGYQTFFEKMGSVPISIAGILMASSVLLFIERLISSNSKLFM